MSDDIYNEIYEEFGPSAVNRVPMNVFLKQLREAQILHGKMTREEIDSIMAIRHDFHKASALLAEIKIKIAEREGSNV